MCTGNDHINPHGTESVINDLVPRLQGVSHAEDEPARYARISFLNSRAHLGKNQGAYT